MTTFDAPGSVVVGVDGSVTSDRAVTWATRYAAAHRLPVLLVHAAGDVVPSDFVLDVPEARERLRATGERVLLRAETLVHQVDPSVRVGARLRLHDPRDLLVEAARHADLLVVGSRGHGLVVRLLLGSVSAAMVGHAPCTLVVVREPVAGTGPVLVGVDGSADSSDALGFAFEMAAARGVPLEVVHALGDPWLFPAPPLPGPEAMRRIREEWDVLFAESLAGYGEKYPDVVVHRRLVQESPAHALVHASSTAAVVVVGARGRSRHGSPLHGSVARAVAERAHCTVAVVRSIGDRAAEERGGAP